MHIHVSDGNSKLGRVWNISLPPVQTCRRQTPCAKDCYALKAYRQYPEVRRAWDENLALAKADIHEFERQLVAFLTRKRRKTFRWHVSGDIPSPQYLAAMSRVAERLPDWQFMAMTKRAEWLAGKEFPANLTLIVSVWETCTTQKRHSPLRMWSFPRTWLAVAGVPDNVTPV